MKIDKIRVGRPIKYSFKEKQVILDALKVYVESEEYPTMPAFAVKQGISKRRIYEFARGENENADTVGKYPLEEFFNELIELMNSKQETFIEQNVLLGRISPQFATFKLRQPGIGWIDSRSIELTDAGTEKKLTELLSGK